MSGAPPRDGPAKYSPFQRSGATEARQPFGGVSGVKRIAAKRTLRLAVGPPLPSAGPAKYSPFQRSGATEARQPFGGVSGVKRIASKRTLRLTLVSPVTSASSTYSLPSFVARNSYVPRSTHWSGLAS